ncbi:MAG: hypothetical protein QOH81_427 [Sphingomonadales bacterium]|jgi:hypothetical protein|nr:hypothetical protein [Sphingomonadales bacterium]
MRRPLFLLSLCLAACGSPVPDGNASLDQNPSNPADIVTPGLVPVRVGELGPNFEACSAAGTTRHIEAGQSLPVRAAPFDNAAQTGAVPAGARFFVCSRSIDQKWFGIVYDPGGALAPACGVSKPANARHAYAGPCKSGWIQSAYVKVIAGDDQPPPVANPVAPAPAEG